uniref:Uncharacterized protein n=1 Tax=Oryza brachyantha TaxID=4533 RepID=J3N3F2_ORYBR
MKTDRFGHRPARTARGTRSWFFGGFGVFLTSPGSGSPSHRHPRTPPPDSRADPPFLAFRLLFSSLPPAAPSPRIHLHTQQQQQQRTPPPPPRTTKTDEEEGHLLGSAAGRVE